MVTEETLQKDTKFTLKKKPKGIEYRKDSGIGWGSHKVSEVSNACGEWRIMAYDMCLNVCVMHSSAVQERRQMTRR